MCTPANRPSRAPRPASRPRRSQAERSAATKLQIFRTTLDVLAERGYASLRTAEIVERAGLSKGAMLHHFRTKDDLMIAVADYAMEDVLRDEQERIAAMGETADPLAAFIDAQRAYFFGPFVQIQWELQAAARTDRKLGRKLEEITSAYRATRAELWSDVLVRRGIPAKKVALVLDMTFSLWRGFWVQYMRDRSQLRELNRRGDAIAAALQTMLETYLQKD
jgi:AcrR family transcriptional regulator